MDYQYTLAKLQYDKEKMEELITRHNRRIGQVFPHKLEQELWRLNSTLLARPPIQTMA